MSKIEEKAKAYDEAIKRVENIRIGKCETTFMFTEGLLEHIFPELAENENERIRKKILKLVKEHSVNHERCQMETWLEKQVEQKHQYNSRPRYVGEGELLGKKDTDDLYLKGVCDAKQELEKQGEQKPILDVEIPFGADSELVEEAITIPDGCYAIIEDNKVILRKGEMKSSWSEDDEKRLKVIAEELVKFISIHKYGTPLSVDDITWLKTLKERIQPKQEWSDEDEKMLQNILECLRNGWKELPTDILKYESWLKSLRPQSTLKPSDEQLDSLYDVLNPCDGFNREVLESLYVQLKKLREE